MDQGTRQRRPKGTGGVHQRKDGLWCATVDYGYAGGKRNRRSVYGKTREIVEQKLETLLSLPDELRAPPPRPARRSHLTRDEQVAAGNRRKSHTLAEWQAKLKAVGCCVYCGVRSRLMVDHATPLSRGGSNGIDNVVPCCESCNMAKGNRTAAEFIRARLLGA